MAGRRTDTGPDLGRRAGAARSGPAGSRPPTTRARGRRRDRCQAPAGRQGRDRSAPAFTHRLVAGRRATAGTGLGGPGTVRPGVPEHRILAGRRGDARPELGGPRSATIPGAAVPGTPVPRSGTGGGPTRRPALRRCPGRGRSRHAHHRLVRPSGRSGHQATGQRAARSPAGQQGSDRGHRDRQHRGLRARPSGAARQGRTRLPRHGGEVALHDADAGFGGRRAPGCRRCRCSSPT